MASKHTAPLGQVLELAAGYYQYHLKQNHDAKSYLQQRGIDNSTIDSFGFGLSPSGFGQLIAQAKNTVWRNTLQKSLPSRFKGDELTNQVVALMELSGLTATSQQGTQYDRFRNRIVIPILDEHGRVVSFGGRRFLDDKGPKYLNGADTSLFHKRDVIFGLNRIIERRQNLSPIGMLREFGTIYVVEGYMDVVSMHQFEFWNSVAAMGTALSSEQISKLFEHTDHLTFCFDGDEAGYKAARRAVLNALPVLHENKDISIVHLPLEQDPDSVLRTGLSGVPNKEQIDNGRKLLHASLKGAKSLSHYLIDMHAKDLGVTWGSDPKLLSACVLQNVCSLPDDSRVTKTLTTFLQMQLQTASHKKELSDQVLVQEVRSLTA